MVKPHRRNGFQCRSQGTSTRRSQANDSASRPFYCLHDVTTTLDVRRQSESKVSPAAIHILSLFSTLAFPRSLVRVN